MKLINTQYEEHIPGSSYYSKIPSITPITSLESMRQELLKKGVLTEHESIGDWFENKIATASPLKNSLPDWKHMTKEDLTNMSPEQQKALFKNMPSEGQTTVAKLMKDMSMEEQVALMANMPPEQQILVMGHMDPQDGEQLFSHLDRDEQQGICDVQYQRIMFNQISSSNQQFLARLRDIGDIYIKKE